MKVWILLLISSIAMAAPPANSVLVQDLKKVLDEEVASREKLETELRDLMAEIQNVDIASQNFDIEVDRVKNRLNEVKNRMGETQLRIDFLNSFMSAIDRDKEAIKNLATILLDMSHVQVASGVQNNAESRLWLFELYFSMAVKNYFEPSERFGAFVKSYISYSSLSDPKSPRGFGKSRDYLSYLDEDKTKTTDEAASRTPTTAAPEQPLPALKDLTK